MEDENIIKLLLERSEQALLALAEKYERLCHRIAWNILNNEQDAEECVNDTYLGVWNTVPPQQPNPLQPYVCKITRNLAAKLYHANTAQKRNSHYDVALDELEACLKSSGDAADLLTVHELTTVLNRFLEAQSTENKVIFVRRYWYSDSIEDIASDLQMSKNTISNRLLRLRERLKDVLEKEGVAV